MRELTEYEKKKWFDDLNRFEAPEFLMNGDELGEAYDALVAAEDCGTYISDEIVKALQVEILDMYYYQMIDLYISGMGGQDEPEDFGLPEYTDFAQKYNSLVITESEEITDEHRQAWDWAMDWREEHKEETDKRLRAERLRRELERLES